MLSSVRDMAGFHCQCRSTDPSYSWPPRVRRLHWTLSWDLYLYIGNTHIEHCALNIKTIIIHLNKYSDRGQTYVCVRRIVFKVAKPYI